MKLKLGRFIISSCLNSVDNLVCGSVRVAVLRSQACFKNWISRLISTGGNDTDRNFVCNENNMENVTNDGMVENSNNERYAGVHNMPAYVKLNDSNILIGKVMTAVKSKKNQKSGNEILLEGNRLISDAIKLGAVPKIVFFSRKEDVVKIRWPQENFQLYKVAYKTLKMWSSVTTSPGILGIFKKPQVKQSQGEIWTLPLVIICDNIRDPGNLGSILRVAAGVGCKSVLLTKGCVELWEPKALRSGAGAHFVLSVHSECTWDSISAQYLDSTIVLADNSSRLMEGESGPITTRNDIPLKKYLMVDYSGAWDEGNDVVLILGGETAGLSLEACELAHSRGGIRLNIPLHNDMESLNASTALGIITFEIRRQFDEWLQRNESLPSKSSSS